MTAAQTITVTVTDVAEQSAKPAKPVLAKVTGSTTSLTATWDAPGKNGGPAITGYKLEYRAAPAGTWMEFAHTGTGVTATITGLTADTSYQARVLAENGETDSDWSDASCAVSVGGSTTGTLETGTEHDWLKVELKADTRYQIDTEGADTSRGTLADPGAGLHDASGTSLMVNNNDGGAGSRRPQARSPTRRSRISRWPGR